MLYKVMSHIKSAVVNNIYMLHYHHGRTQFLGSNWIFDNVSEKYREK